MKGYSWWFGAKKFVVAARMTLSLALPTGLMGWAAASLMDSGIGLHSSRPMWFLPLWCLWFFLIAYFHLADQEEDSRLDREDDVLWGWEKRKIPWHRRDGAERFL